MIYLILKMFFYLVMALGLGAAAGWLLRNLLAAKTEEELQRQLLDTRARVPQMETLMRTRDEQIKRLKLDLDEKETQRKSAETELESLQRTLQEKERKLAQLEKQAESARSGTGDALLAAMDDALVTSGAPVTAAPAAEGDDADGLIAELHEEIARLREALESAERRVSEAAGDLAKDRQIQELEARLRQTAMDQDRVSKQLDREPPQGPGAGTGTGTAEQVAAGSAPAARTGAERSRTFQPPRRSSPGAGQIRPVSEASCRMASNSVRASSSGSSPVNSALLRELRPGMRAISVVPETE